MGHTHCICNQCKENEKEENDLSSGMDYNIENGESNGGIK